MFGWFCLLCGLVYVVGCLFDDIGYCCGCVGWCIVELVVILVLGWVFYVGF